MCVCDAACQNKAFVGKQVDNSILLLIQLEEMKSFKIILR